MLYYPFIKQADLLILNNQTYNSYIKAFQAYNNSYTHLLDFYINPEAKDSNLGEDNKNKANQANTNKELLLADFKAFTRQRP